MAEHRIERSKSQELQHVTGWQRHRTCCAYSRSYLLGCLQICNPCEFCWTAGGKLQEVKVSAEKEGAWRVEEEFIGAIRGTEQIQRTSFATGLRYMEFTQAVAASYQTGQAVYLPLTH